MIFNHYVYIYKISFEFSEIILNRSPIKPQFRDKIESSAKRNTIIYASINLFYLKSQEKNNLKCTKSLSFPAVFFFVFNYYLWVHTCIQRVYKNQD